ncbi:uncharacterized protein L201_000796 [Kwoniella dendrophila CBS 6074]|uniref:BTB domain-containing protein n=1 Tax=Kwoniella dendrophila CBS 6074 TaxID=1295534 RepID=A0AAX4JLT0_9TREE
MTDMVDPASEEPQIVWHPSFTSGNVTFIANNGVHLAENCDQLARGSDLFKVMLSLPQPEGVIDGANKESTAVKKDGKIFEIDATSELTAIFLALIYARIPLKPPTTLQDTAKILDLCYKFDCTEEVTKIVRAALIGDSHNRLWELLAIASHRDDVELGKVALEKMNKESFIHGREPHESHGSWFLYRMSKLSWRWQGRLMNLVLKEEEVTANRMGWVTRVSKKGRDYDAREFGPTQIPALTFKEEDWTSFVHQFLTG